MDCFSFCLKLPKRIITYAFEGEGFGEAVDGILHGVRYFDMDHSPNHIHYVVCFIFK